MSRSTEVTRTTVDLSAYPDLVVIYLGLKLVAPRGIGTILRLGPQLTGSVAAKPDGLLLHENLVYSLWPVHTGMRQYWRDLDAVERWTRELPHQTWWTDFLRDPGGTAFWHEAYSRKGGFEAVYVAEGNVQTGLAAFAPLVAATGALSSARSRLQIDSAS